MSSKPERCFAHNHPADYRGEGRPHHNRAHVRPSSARRSTTRADETRTASRPPCAARRSDCRNTRYAVLHAQSQPQAVRLSALQEAATQDETTHELRAPAFSRSSQNANCETIALRKTKRLRPKASPNERAGVPQSRQAKTRTTSAVRSSHETPVHHVESGYVNPSTRAARTESKTSSRLRTTSNSERAESSAASRASPAQSQPRKPSIARDD